MTKKVKIVWLSKPEKHNYTAATSYLSLVYDKKTVAEYVHKLRRAPTFEFKAKDIFRASGLSLLGVSNSHVEKDREKIRSKKRLSPLLLVRDQRNAKVIVADGYHRLCAAYSRDEDAAVPCKIV